MGNKIKMRKTLIVFVIFATLACSNKFFKNFPKFKKSAQGKECAESEEKKSFSITPLTILQAYLAFSTGKMLYGFVKDVLISKPSANSKRLGDVELNKFEEELASSVVLSDSLRDTFSELGGLDGVQRELLARIKCMSRSRSSTSRLLSPTTAVLLYGPPGCGKTALARSLCKLTKYPMISLSPSVLLRKYVGDSPQMTKAVFTLAKKLQPCILFIDEMDSLFRSRRDQDHVVERNLITEFAQLWDDLKNDNSNIFILGSTNRPQDLDQCIQRRFETSYLVGPPDAAAREEIFRILLKDTALEDGFDFRQCALWTNGYTPSDILGACRSAVIHLETETDTPAAASVPFPINLLSSNQPPHLVPSPGGGGGGGGKDSSLDDSARHPLTMKQIRSAIVNSVPISWRSKDFSESSNKFSDESFLNSNYNDNEDEMKQIDRYFSKPSMDKDMVMPPTLPQLFDFGSKDTKNDNNGDNNNEDNENNNDVDEMDFDDEEDEDDEFDNK